MSVNTENHNQEPTTVALRKKKNSAEWMWIKNREDAQQGKPLKNKTRWTIREKDIVICVVQELIN